MKFSASELRTIRRALRLAILTEDADVDAHMQHIDGHGEERAVIPYWRKHVASVRRNIRVFKKLLSKLESSAIRQGS